LFVCLYFCSFLFTSFLLIFCKSPSQKKYEQYIAFDEWASQQYKWMTPRAVFMCADLHFWRKFWKFSFVKCTQFCDIKK
jgi:hypothetical protein